MEKLLQSLCSAQSAKDIEGRIFNEDETKLPPSQTYEICIISRITTLALHFLIFRKVQIFTFITISEFPTWYCHPSLSSTKKTWSVVFCHLSFSSQPHILYTKLAASWPQVWIFCIFEEIIFPQSWRTSFQLEYQTVKFHCTFVYTSISFFQSQKIIAITIWNWNLYWISQN